MDAAMRRLVTAAALVLGLALAGCDTFDPIDKFQDWDIMGSGKTPVKGERREVFPSGVPGVPQGVPADMVKGYQPPPEPPAPVVEAKEKAKEKTKPKKTASAQRKQARQQPAAPPPEPGDAPPPEPARTQTVRGGNQMQQMPGAQPTWPAGAQPAPAR